VTTRSAEKSEELRLALKRCGACVLTIPLMRHAIASDLSAFEEAASAPARYSHLLFTSQTTVRFFVEACSLLGVSPTAWARTRVGAVGQKTATALREIGLPPAVVAEGGGKALAMKLLRDEPLKPGSRVLLPQSTSAQAELREALEAAQVVVDAVGLYETVGEDPAKLQPLLQDAFGSGPPDAVVFASPSALHAFLELASPESMTALASGATRIVSIGPTTSASIRERGLVVAAEAVHPTVADIVEATIAAVSSASNGRA